jgi:hypothetical protein
MKQPETGVCLTGLGLRDYPEYGVHPGGGLLHEQSVLREQRESINHKNPDSSAIGHSD